MNSAIAKLFVLAAMYLVIVMAMGAAGSGAAARGTTRDGGAIFPRDQARTCVPLGGRCVGLTDCCIGRCINNRCLKL